MTKFFENILSIKNENRHKVVRLLGTKIKIKRKCKNVEQVAKFSYPADYDPECLEILEKVKDYTMTDVNIMYGMYQAMVYLEKNKIEGDIVECGVWKGGSCMIAALVLKKFKNTNRKIYLYDTFSGMVSPTENDVELGTNELAIDSWVKRDKNNTAEDLSNWCNAGLEEVKSNMLKTAYPEDKIVYIKGKVQDTIANPAYEMPEKIALLRLDTDWYDSTKHEMEHLYPRLVKNGVLIIDDYGQWQGQKKAIDEYMEKNNDYLLLNRILGARMAIKTNK